MKRSYILVPTLKNQATKKKKNQATVYLLEKNKTKKKKKEKKQWSVVNRVSTYYFEVLIFLL